MVKDVQQSLVLRTGMALAAVILLAIVNMLASYLTAESSENDAVRINLAGALRMQTYRIANAYILAADQASPADARKLAQAITDFETRLSQPVLADHIRASSNLVLGKAFARVEEGWALLKPQLQTPAMDAPLLLQRVDSFVTEINAMVKKLELQTESKFRVLRVIQGICLALTICLATIMFLNVYKYVVGPLNQMLDMAAKLRAGDFSMRLNSSGDDDELTLLATTFNDMAGSLDTMYRDLEDKIRDKTQHLEDTQEALRFLYDTSRRLSGEGDIVEKLERTVDHLQRQINAARIDIHLNHESPEHPFLITSVSAPPTSPLLTVSATADTGEKIDRYPLQHDNRDYGYLKLVWPDSPGANREQHQMLTALADTIAATLATQRREDQEHRVALIEERTAIARELHDSIAQSLSFTKIQISRFQALQAKRVDPAQLDEVLAEIKAGIQAAYAQLRELLATFRLQLDSPGLQASLLATAREFEDKGQLSIALHSSLQNYPLTPNEEIHVLQIVREALSNVLRHSGADQASIDLALHDQIVEVRIQDNGCGFSKAASGHNHYGQTIMLERAAILGGTITFSDRNPGGAEVMLRFPPEHAGEGIKTIKNSADLQT